MTALMKTHQGCGTMVSSSILQALGLSSPAVIIDGSYADSSRPQILTRFSISVSFGETGDQVANENLSYVDQKFVSNLRIMVQQLHPVGKEGNGSFLFIIVGTVLTANKEGGKQIDEMGTRAERRGKW